MFEIVLEPSKGQFKCILVSVKLLKYQKRTHRPQNLEKMGPGLFLRTKITFYITIDSIEHTL